jgi:hypothetical protein
MDQDNPVRPRWEQSCLLNGASYTDPIGAVRANHAFVRAGADDIGRNGGLPIRVEREDGLNSTH